MRYDCIVIGGGASGMVAAIFAARRGQRIAIIEHRERLGKKILATGNGKCNYTNQVQTPDCYRGTHPEFAMAVLRQFDVEQTIAFFQSLGIYPRVRNGYVYPNSEQATAVADVLCMELKNLKVDVFLKEHILNIEKDDQGFLLRSEEKKEYRCNKVVVATGGLAAPKQGSDGSGLKILRRLGHTIIEPFPALVQLKAEGKFFKLVSGVRIDAKGELFSGSKKVTEEIGEFLFTDYGISGIPVFQISRYAVASVMQKKNTQLLLDFFPHLNENELQNLWYERINHGGYKTVVELFTGLLNNKLSSALLVVTKINPDGSAKKLSKQENLDILSLLKRFPITITGSNGFENAQVSAGGVSTEEVNTETMESKLVKGLYLTGEILDIDGTCGGYNLQWAWTTGAVAGQHIGK